MMGALELRNKLQELMQYANDMDLAKAFDEFVEDYKSSKSAMSKAQQKEVDKIRAKYLAGKGKSYSWNEIKQDLVDNYGLQA